MRRSLREENEKRSRFLMAVSHDLSTPLTSIRGYIEAIEDGLAQSPQDLKKYLDIMMEKSKVLEGRIGKLIEYVQMGTDEWKMTQNLTVSRFFLTASPGLYKEDAIILKRNSPIRTIYLKTCSLYKTKGCSPVPSRIFSACCAVSQREDASK
jgi:signal transduction histidine kinase